MGNIDNVSKYSGKLFNRLQQYNKLISKLNNHDQSYKSENKNSREIENQNDYNLLQILAMQNYVELRFKYKDLKKVEVALVSENKNRVSCEQLKMQYEDKVATVKTSNRVFILLSRKTLLLRL